jgi:hypothetical protein
MTAGSRIEFDDMDLRVGKVIKILLSYIFPYPDDLDQFRKTHCQRKIG